MALRDEVTGLREASQLRAIIEQAKGVLMERDRISAEEAFARLRALSQEHNVRLVEVAATVVGVTVPRTNLPLDQVDHVIRARLPSSVSASRAWREFQRQPEVSVGLVGALLDVVASGTERGEDAAALLSDLLRPFDVDAVVLYRRLADESLSLVGSTGVPPDLVSSWSRIPPVRELPFITAILNRRSYFWATAEERAALFPAVAGLNAPYQASAVIPVFEGDDPTGVVGLMWNEPHPLHRRRHHQDHRPGPTGQPDAAAHRRERGTGAALARCHPALASRPVDPARRHPVGGRSDPRLPGGRRCEELGRSA